MLVEGGADLGEAQPARGALDEPRLVSARSSRATCLLTADFDIPRRRAAPEKLLASATRANTAMLARCSTVDRFLLETIIFYMAVLSTNCWAQILPGRGAASARKGRNMEAILERL
ncbi:MAG TPA: hypothetical protein VNK67_14275, partial [Burkholderiales bacterium]|nr:hypothetical protein [Burkholderiales bacterium]